MSKSGPKSKTKVWRCFPNVKEAIHALYSGTGATVNEDGERWKTYEKAARSLISGQGDDQLEDEARRSRELGILDTIACGDDDTAIQLVQEHDLHKIDQFLDKVFELVEQKWILPGYHQPAI